MYSRSLEADHHKTMLWIDVAFCNCFNSLAVKPVKFVSCCWIVRLCILFTLLTFFNVNYHVVNIRFIFCVRVPSINGSLNSTCKARQHWQLVTHRFGPDRSVPLVSCPQWMAMVPRPVPCSILGSLALSINEKNNLPFCSNTPTRFET